METKIRTPYGVFAVILAVLIVFLVVAVTILIFKLRDLYYGDYDEEEEEEEYVAPQPQPQKRVVVDDSDIPPFLRKLKGR